MMMTPRHAGYRQLFSICSDIGDTFDYLPAKNTPYPFFFLGTASSRPLRCFDGVTTVRYKVDLYGTREQRRTLEEMVGRFWEKVKQADVAFDYRFRCVWDNEEVIPDNTDVTPLLHYILTVEAELVRKD